MEIKGTVIKSTGSNYWVKVDGEIVEAKIRGKFRLKGFKATNPVAVGDYVGLKKDESDWVIDKIEERKNYLIRKSTNLSKQHHIIASNVDLIVVIATLAEPYTTYEFIDRITVSAEAYDIDCLIVLNKIDLLNSEKEKFLHEDFIATYQKAGIEVLETSVNTNFNIDELKKKLKSKTSILTGHSGVGKSSLIKAIDRNIDLRISQVSDYHKTGKHTTTFAEMFEINLPAKIIDTPGLRAFGVVDFEKENLSHYFKEFQGLLGQCKFQNCNHNNEPGCIIIEKVEAEEIAFSRYKSYLNLFHEEYNPYR